MASEEHTTEVKIDVSIPEQVTDLIQEQKQLADRMIAHLANYEIEKGKIYEKLGEFDDEKTQVNETLVEMAKWKLQEENKLRKVARFLFIGILLWALGGAVSGFFLWKTVVDQGRVDRQTVALVAQNRALIQRVDALNRAQAEKAYKDCVDRNARSVQSQKDLTKLVRAHRADKSTNAAKIWTGYLNGLKKHKLPPCTRPDPNETK